MCAFIRAWVRRATRQRKRIDQPESSFAIAARVADRAKRRMEYLTDSQWAVLGEELKAEIDDAGGGGMVDKVFAWRKNRGDFNSAAADDDDDDDNNERRAFLGDLEVPQLPSDMEGVTETSLRLGFLKSDLQFECLLRRIAYDASDSKSRLISKLMDYKGTLFLKANTFQILQDPLFISTYREDVDDDDDEEEDYADEDEVDFEGEAFMCDEDDDKQEPDNHANGLPSASSLSLTTRAHHL